MRRTLPSLLAVAALAGCLTEPQEALCPATEYVTIHYDERLDRTLLREAFVEDGYAWRDGPGGNAYLDPPALLDGDVRGVVAPVAGPSAAGTTVSFEAEGPEIEPGQVLVVARDAAEVVNATFGNPPIEEWVAGEHREGC